MGPTDPDRPRWRHVMPPAVAMVLAVVVVAEIAWAAFVLAGSDDLRPHAVPAVVAADPVVAESVARQYDDLPGDPFDLRAVTLRSCANQRRSVQSRPRVVCNLRCISTGGSSVHH